MHRIPPLIRSPRAGRFSRRRIHLARSVWVRLALLFLAAAALGLALPNLLAEAFARQHTYTLATAPSVDVAIVFGAGLTRSGTPSAILRDRVETAAELYFAGKVKKLLMSGDNRFIDYNEPGAMREYAMRLGVPDQDIVLDFAGRRTYDTCYRARHIFGVKNAVLVTQSFHLTRAIYTCNGLGVDSTGIPSDVRRYGRRMWTYWRIREIPATSVAVWEVWISRPLPVLGKPEPIFRGESMHPPLTTTGSQALPQP
jgi:SanA protein